MDWFEFLASLTESLTKIAWPAAAFGCVWVLRDELRKLLPRAYIQHGEFRAGFYAGQATVIDQVIDQTKEIAPPIETRNLQKLSNTELRSRCASITKELRDFEFELREKRDIWDRDSKIDRQGNWTAFVKKLTETSNESLRRWRSDFQPRAVAIRDELVRRLGPKHGVDMEDATIALDYGMLAGVSPISDAALAIEKLCRALPD